MRPIEAAKQAVPVIDLVARLCGPDGLRRVGSRWVARCPLPGHDDRTPSFTIYSETNSWHCYGCLRGGDVVTLAAAAWGYSEHEQAMAAANLLQEFGHPIPERPRHWYAKQERQRPVREQIRRNRAEVLRRRLFAVCMIPVIRATATDETSYRLEVEEAWRDFQRVPVETMLDDYDNSGRV